MRQNVPNKILSISCDKIMSISCDKRHKIYIKLNTNTGGAIPTQVCMTCFHTLIYYKDWKNYFHTVIYYIFPQTRGTISRQKHTTCSQYDTTYCLHIETGGSISTQ